MKTPLPGLSPREKNRVPVACFAESSASSSEKMQQAPSEAVTRDAYVAAVLALYLWLPETATRTSRHDRRLACTLYDRGVSLLVVEAAFLLGSARRALREPYLAPLPRIRAAHYFLPVIQEVLESPREPDREYLQCLVRRLHPLAELKRTRLAHERRYGSR